ncbi:MAG: sodium-independent anion transporter [Coriobacteriales bacterium]|nr:sodium-independent anion transporter [Coriobacteriales bacterium]
MRRVASWLIGCIEDVKDARQIPGLLIYRFDAPLFFANARVFRERVLERDLRKRDVELAFAEMKHLVSERMRRYGLLDALGGEALYPTTGSAVHAYLHDYEVDWADWEEAQDGGTRNG